MVTGGTLIVVMAEGPATTAESPPTVPTSRRVGEEVGSMLDVHAVAGLLDELADLVSERDRGGVVELRARLAERRFRVLVVGEAKRGKSTLINAMLGREVVPTGVTPVTALPAALRSGRPERVLAEFTDGHAEHLPLTALTELVTERANPGNRRGVTRVVVALDPAVALLEGGVELIDTPGVGSVFTHNTAEATTALSTMDAAVMVLTADPPMSASERDLLRTVHDRSVALFVALNKMERLDPAERDEAVAFTREQVAAALGAADGAGIAVYPLSARLAFAARAGGAVGGAVGGGAGDLAASGLPALEHDLAAYLAHGAAADLGRSVAGHARRLTQRVADEAAVTLRAADLTADHAAERVATFRARVDRLDHYRRDTTDVVRASVGRLLADLADTTRWDTPRLVSEVRAEVAGHLDRELAGASAATIDSQGRAYAVERTRRAAEVWRGEQRRRVQAALTSLDHRLAGLLADELAAVRAAARDLLGTDLALPAPAGRLLPDRAPAYAFAAEEGMTTALADSLRRLLPGRLGHRLARRHLLDELDLLVGKQTGRIRAAFQDDLTAASRALVKAVEARYTDALGGLMAALNAATDLANAPDQANRRDALRSRLAALRRLDTDLTRHTDPARHTQTLPDAQLPAAQQAEGRLS
jgi:GTP-binding protein EngB required for normal cell division